MNRRTFAASTVALATGALATGTALAARTRRAPPSAVLQDYTVPRGSHPHDVAPAPDGRVWYTAQVAGKLGRLDPGTGEIEQIPLGSQAAPHGVIVGPDGAPWITDGGQNAILRVDPDSLDVARFPLPPERGGANLNTATFDPRGILWFTGQSGVYGHLDPTTGQMSVYDSPRGPGPYGMATAPDGTVWYVSLAGNYLGRVDAETGATTVIDPPTPRQGARRVWPDSNGFLWISEWNAGQAGRFDPGTGAWREWKLPGARPQAYAVYVDEHDTVWLTDWGANALVRFDPAAESFETFRYSQPGAEVRQLLGRPGEVWGAMSGLDRLVVARSA